MTKSKKLRPFNALRDARQKLGLSQIELAEHLDVSRTTIITAEQGTPRQWMPIACVGLSSLFFIDAGVKPLTGLSFTAHREMLGLSQRALGEKLGFARSTIVNWERTSPPLWAHPAMIGLTVMTLAS